MSKNLHYSCGCLYASVDDRAEIICLHLCDLHKQHVLSDAMKSLEVKDHGGELLLDEF